MRELSERSADEMAERLEVYRQACVEYAAAALSEREAGKTIGEAEWTATAATAGLTKVIPMELEVWKISQSLRFAG